MPRNVSHAHSASTSPSLTVMESYDINATDSTLLRLPPEVRNHIWRSMLGGKTIHITAGLNWQDNVSEIRHTICNNVIGDKDDALACKAKNQVEPQSSYSQRHLLCGPLAIPGDEQLPISILQTCRQIHQEAALLPFTDNTLSFRSGQALEAYVKSILLFQARAIRSITFAPKLYASGRGNDLFTTYVSYTSASTLDMKLKSLKELVVFVEHEDHGGLPNARHPTVDLVADYMALFGRLTITSATVAVYNVPPTQQTYNRRTPNGVVSAEVSRIWAEQQEQLLLAEWVQDEGATPAPPAERRVSKRLQGKA